MSDSSKNEPGDSTLWADASLVGVAVIWGANIPIMKTGLDGADTFTFNAVRLLLSVTILGTLALWERRRGILPSPGVTWKQIVIYAAIVSATYQLTFLIGIDLTKSGNVALIIATVPMWTALLASIFIGEKLRPLAWLGLFVALVGTAVVALQGEVDAKGKYLLGNVTVLFAALLWSAGTVYSRPLLKKISPIQLAASAGAIAWPVHVLFALFMAKNGLTQFSAPKLWLIILYSGLLSSGLAQPMWHFGVQRAGAAHAAIVQNLIPLVAIVVAWLTRGEDPTMPQLLGGAMILAGLIMMRWRRDSNA